MIYHNLLTRSNPETVKTGQSDSFMKISSNVIKKTYETNKIPQGLMKFLLFSSE